MPTGWKQLKAKGQSRPQTPGPFIQGAKPGGGENRSGKNPGAMGSNPVADTNLWKNFFIKQ
ncbi:hypothetical protein AOR01nite_17490 [Acetobacter orleanensis]|uniref:Uncharacterized protein n=1 Tax=Acetobacter orleanensis TaxID=104099 RepID=A0A4Y3TN35_9PROT|nr:hypothetical protein Abol_020_084 [Acetobacter orleanensis JCM 7639]GEB83272.1 hypothetical protein AOR01nite_17490 [Acetobacter orleanensis]